MPSAHCDSNGSSGSGDQTLDFDGVHAIDDVSSLLEHNKIDCGQPMLMDFQFITPHIYINTSINHNVEFKIFAFFSFFESPISLFVVRSTLFRTLLPIYFECEIIFFLIDTGGGFF